MNPSLTSNDHRFIKENQQSSQKKKKKKKRDLHGLSSKDSHDGVRDVGWDDVHRVDMELMEEFDVLSRAVRVPQGVIEGVFAHRLLQVFCQFLDRQWLVCSG